MLNSGKNHLRYLLKGTLARTQPMRIKLVGQIRFENPSPNWKASTAICLFIPMRSDNGAIMGIVVAAWPDPEGTRKFITVWKRSIPTDPRYKEPWFRRFAIE